LSVPERFGVEHQAGFLALQRRSPISAPIRSNRPMLASSISSAECGVKPHADTANMIA
jgi:hypothetical protein